MKITVIGIFDRKAQIFISLEPTSSTAVAVRQFQEQVCKNTESPFHKWPADFSLWELGTFDTESGYMQPRLTEEGQLDKKLIVEAESLKN